MLAGCPIHKADKSKRLAQTSVWYFLQRRRLFPVKPTAFQVQVAPDIAFCTGTHACYCETWPTCLAMHPMHSGDLLDITRPQAHLAWHNVRYVPRTATDCMLCVFGLPFSVSSCTPISFNTRIASLQDLGVELAAQSYPRAKPTQLPSSKRLTSVSRCSPTARAAEYVTDVVSDAQEAAVPAALPAALRVRQTAATVRLRSAARYH